jgi:hypothetical protein
MQEGDGVSLQLHGHNPAVLKLYVETDAGEGGRADCGDVANAFSLD